MTIERDAGKEIEAMKVIADELAKLDEPGVRRVLRWAADAFGANAVVGANRMASSSADESAEPQTKYDSLADFYAATSPSTESDKALVVGYWTQILQGEAEFDAQSVNKELKHLGHGVGNITSAFDGLIKRKPQLVIQTRKAGTSRQARKLYKLTLEGQRSVEGMISHSAE